VVVLLPWALLLGGGLAGSIHLADRAAGTAPPPGPGYTHGVHARWQRPNGAAASAVETETD
jgi:hypothetical protein